MIQLNQTQMEKFCSNIEIDNKTECWNWIGTTINSGGKGAECRRAILCVQNKTFVAARVAFELIYAVEPGDMFVCHKCDNALCVNPSHLFLGSPKDNMMDKVQKGRNRFYGNQYTGEKL